MRSQAFSSTFAVLVLSSCVLEGYSVPQARYAVEDYARKFGSAPAADNLSNELSEKSEALAKEEGSLLTTVLELALKFVPQIIDILSGSTDPQANRVDGIDLTGEDPFSVRNIAFLGLKLFLAIAGGSSSGVDRNDVSSPIQDIAQPVLGAVIGALTGSEDKNEVATMAKQATEVINLVVTLVEALTTSMSQRSFSDY